jgi:hypothetical protein
MTKRFDGRLLLTVTVLHDALSQKGDYRPSGLVVATRTLLDGSMYHTLPDGCHGALLRDQSAYGVLPFDQHVGW